jgi:rhamnose utilization protein RhaD (predicted bifunctional aldolase and dehydrogenase)
MQLLSLFSSLALMAAVVSAADRGSYTSPGIGARKKAILHAGGNTRDMAIAMLET